jgi:hypothetical protein
MDNIITNITSEQLRAAAAIKDQISRLEADLAALLGGGKASPAPAVAAPGKKRGRKPGSKNKATAAAAPSAVPAKKKAAKRKMSAEGRARIIAAQKARWAKVKAGK